MNKYFKAIFRLISNSIYILSWWIFLSMFIFYAAPLVHNLIISSDWINNFPLLNKIVLQIGYIGLVIPFFITLAMRIIQAGGLKTWWYEEEVDGMKNKSLDFFYEVIIKIVGIFYFIIAIALFVSVF
tara:strand:- start:101 stop:481 length:381 start_codon:yes stop_codon:yes gene_type:complete